MPYLIGIDEAGYGPNLGPLVVAGSLWQVPVGLTGDELYDHLSEVICPEGSANRWHVADSKVLHQSSRGIAALEEETLIALALLGLDGFAGDQIERTLGLSETRNELPWQRLAELTGPIRAATEVVHARARQVAEGLAQQGVRLLALRARRLFPSEFNAAVAEHGNKAEALSRTSVSLVNELLQACGEEPVFVACDKHGGRSRYSRFLQETFADSLIEIIGESSKESCYRWGPSGRRVEIRFRVSGEACLPTALASMIAKYVRELAMHTFNHYWQQEVPGVKSTAGYPVDARRFYQDIAARRAELGIQDHLIWRSC